MENASKKWETTLLAAWSVAMIFLAFWLNGTGDDGDSVQHYLFARHAFQHPENFFEHWAKPLYVMFMAPFAQAGFVGVKLANIGLMAATFWLTFRMAERIGLRPAQLPMLFAVASPIVTILTLSGLTEPMFACWLALGVHLAMTGRLVGATAWVSFLPFVRSEGLVILCVWAVYLLVKKAWCALPLLLAGHAVLAVLGYPTHKDLLWVFNKIPYSNLDSSTTYGSGKWTHFVEHFPDVFGPAVSVFVAAGLLMGLWRLLRFWSGKGAFGVDELWLVYGLFVGLFAAHTMFWALGIFNSYGLMRVLLGVLPMISLIAARGAEPILALAQRKNFGKIALAALALAAIWGMNLKRRWRDDLCLNTDQIAYQRLGEKYREQLRGYTVYMDAVYPAVTLDLDLFDPMQRRHTPRLFTGEPVPPRSAVLWDYRYSVVDAGTTLEKVQRDPRFRQLDVFEDNGRGLAYLFVVTDSFAQNANVLRALDFEKGDLDGTVSDFGKDSQRSFRLDRQHEYSPGVEGMVKNFPAGGRLVLSCDVFAHQTEGVEGVKIVVSYETAVGKVEDWQSFPLIPGTFTAEQWCYVEFEKSVETEKFRDLKLKIYLWNPGATPIFVDNLRVEMQ